MFIFIVGSFCLCRLRADKTCLPPAEKSSVVELCNCHSLDSVRSSMCPLGLEQITQGSRCELVLQEDFSICVALQAFFSSWVLASLDLESACPSRSCRLEVLIPVLASGHHPFWCRWACKYDVYVLRKQLDEQIVPLHLPIFSSMFTVSAPGHADGIVAKLKGLFRPTGTRSISRSSEMAPSCTQCNAQCPYSGTSRL